MQAQFDRVIYTEDRQRVDGCGERCVTRSEPAGADGRVQRRRRVPADRAGIQEVWAYSPHWSCCSVSSGAGVGRDPDALAIVAVATAFILLFVAGFTDVNTITPLLVSMIELGVGIDYSLFIVTRFRQLLDGLAPDAPAAELAPPRAARCSPG